jgi:DNA-binding PadR family transcriptional regulator
VSVTPRKPTREELLSIIDDASRYDGNVTTHVIRHRLGSAYGWHTEPTEVQLRQVLTRLLAEDLVVKDGARHDGGHFALTFKGKRKLAQLRERHAHAA